jgi:hypothetical protein
MPFDGLDAIGLIERRHVVKAGGDRVHRHRGRRRHARTVRLDEQRVRCRAVYPVVLYDEV